MNAFTRLHFPKHFVWGTATASYQIEGAHNIDGRSPSIWDTFSHTAGKTKNGDTGDVACDHYHRYLEDFDLMQSLGFDAYRFSLSWSRILPNGYGAVNQKGIDFYDRVVDALLERKITPYATMFHWDLPQVLEDKGGWVARDTALAFAEYSDVITSRLGDRIKHWATLNEPWCAAFLGYGIGIHAPGQTNPIHALQASHHLLLAHGYAMPIIRQNVQAAVAGIVLNPSPAYPATDSNEDIQAARRMDGFQNRWFLDPVFGRGYPEDMLEQYGQFAPKTEAGDFEKIAAPLDFVGINYYSRGVIAAPSATPSFQEQFLGFRSVELPNVPRTFFGWEVYPQGLTDFLVRLQREYAPKSILITENGATYQDVLRDDDSIHDHERTRYFQSHLSACLAALELGVKLDGYFAWSFMDNFEWAEGFEKRFGITYVDFATQKRSVKHSGKWFQALLRGETEA
jgi:beta-glucosidase